MSAYLHVSSSSNGTRGTGPASCFGPRTVSYHHGVGLCGPHPSPSRTGVSAADCIGLCVPYLNSIYPLTTSAVSAADCARSCVPYLNGIYHLTTSGAFAADCGGSCISYLHGTYPLTTSDVLPLIAADHVYHICMVHTLSQLPAFLPLLAADHV